MTTAVSSEQQRHLQAHLPRWPSHSVRMPGHRIRLLCDRWSTDELEHMAELELWQQSVRESWLRRHSPRLRWRQRICACEHSGDSADDDAASDWDDGRRRIGSYPVGHRLQLWRILHRCERGFVRKGRNTVQRHVCAALPVEPCHWRWLPEPVGGICDLCERLCVSEQKKEQGGFTVHVSV